MEVDTIMQAIGTLGFPIVCAAALFWYVVKIGREHKEEISRLSDAINNNTNVITQLMERLTGRGDEK